MDRTSREPRALPEKFLYLLAALAVVSSLWVLWGRYTLERANNTVEIAVDYPGILSLVRTDGPGTEELLRRFKQAGATSVAVPEESAAGAMSRGDLLVFTAGDLARAEAVGGSLSPLFAEMAAGKSLRPDRTYVAIPKDREGEPRIRRIEARFQNEVSALARVGGWRLLEIAAERDEIEKAGVGLPVEVVEGAAKAGLLVVPRFRNYPSVGSARIEALFEDVPVGARLSTVVFEGDEVLGYPRLLEEMARTLSQNGVRLGLIEFTGQLGAETLAKEAGYEAVRVHSIPKRDMEGMSVSEAVDRLMRAARERNAGLLYVRLFQTPKEGGDLQELNLGYVRELRRRLESAGYQAGAARPFELYHPPLWSIALMMTGSLAGGLWLQRRFVRLPAALEVLFLVLAVAGLAVLFLRGQGVLARQFAALLAALAFPSLAVISVLPLPGRARPDERCEGAASRPSVLVPALLGFIRVSAVSAAGGLLVAGLLSETSFMLKVEQFVGVKLSYAFPPMVVLGAYIWGGEAKLREIPGRLRRIALALDKPVKAKHLLAGIVVVTLGAVYLARTGNDMLGSADFERYFRLTLERLLSVRPRTKELFLGHPALVMGLAFLAGGKLRVAVPMLVISTIGQLSMVNTLSHIHTPLAASALRITYGIVPGVLIGIIGFLIWNYFAGLLDPRPGALDRERGPRVSPGS